MVELVIRTLVVGDDSSAVELPSVVGRDADRDGRLRDGLLERFVGGLDVLVARDEDLGVLLLVLAGAVLRGIRDGLLGRHAVFFDPGEGVVHEAAVAAVIFVFAVDEFLLGQLEHRLLLGDGLA